MRLRTLGELKLERADGEHLAGRRKELSLLAYLARRAPRAASREMLADLFWGDRPEARARASLRQAIFALRQQLGERLVVSAESVALEQDAVLLDAAVFERAAREGRHREALELWGGDFLAGLEDIGSVALRDWLEAERALLRGLLYEACGALVATAVAEGGWTEALRTARFWSENFPLHDEPRLRLQELARLGDGPPDGAGPPSPSGHAGPAGPAAPELAGRSGEFRALREAWSRVAAGGSAVVLVQGEAGVGKTRLCEELLRSLAAEEAPPLVLRACGWDGGAAHAWGVVRELLGSVHTAAGLGGVPDAALAEVARLAPSVRERFPRLPAASDDDGALREAVLRLVADLAEEAPVVVFVDDLPRADAASLGLIQLLARRTPPAVLLLGAHDDELARAPEAAALGRVAALQRLHLAPLDGADLELMLASMLPLAAPRRGELARRLHRETGGNPGLVQAFVAGLAEEGLLEAAAGAADEPGGDDLPLVGRVREAVRHRLDSLGGDARHLLSVLAALDPPVAAGRLARRAGLSDAAFGAALDELLGAGLLHEAEGRSGYEARPAVVRRVAREHPAAARGGPLPRAARWGTGRAVRAAGRRRRRWRGFTALAGLVALAAGFGTGYTLWDRPARAAVEPAAAADTHIAVFPFTYRGGERHAYLAEGMVDLLGVRLDGVPGLTPVDKYALAGRLRETAYRAGDLAGARQVARQFGAALFVMGDLLEVDGGVMLSASLYDARQPGAPLAKLAVRGGEPATMEMADEVALRLLASAGGRLAGGAANEQFLAATPIVTRSLPALKAYLEGERRLREGMLSEAREAFRAAVVADSAFGLAYYRLAITQDWMNVGGEQEAELALRHSERLPLRERELVGALLAYLRHDAVAAEHAYRSILRRYPFDVEAWRMLGETYFHHNAQRGRSFTESREAFEQVLAADPRESNTLIHLARVAAAEGDRAGLEALVERFITLYSQSERVVEMRALLAHAGGSATARAKVEAELAAHAASHVVDLSAKSVAVHTGDLAGAQALVRLLRRPPHDPLWRTRAALMDAQLAAARGRWREAEAALAADDLVDPTAALILRAYLAGALPAPLDPQAIDLLRHDVQTGGTGPSLLWRQPAEPLPHFVSSYVLGLLETRTGDLQAVRSRLASLQADTPPAEQPLRADLARTLRAHLASAEGREHEALLELERQTNPRLQAATPVILFFGRGPERFLRAELLRRLGRPREALDWYGSFPDPAGYDLVYLAPSHLRRAQIHEALGEPAAARHHYTRFIELWGDADAELQPLVAAARRSMAGLGGGP